MSAGAGRESAGSDGDAPRRTAHDDVDDVRGAAHRRWRRGRVDDRRRRRAVPPQVDLRRRRRIFVDAVAGRTGDVGALLSGRRAGRSAVRRRPTTPADVVVRPSPR